MIPEAEAISLGCSLQREQLCFIGKPSACVGQVSIVNRSTEKVRLKKIPLSSPRLRGPIEVPLTHLPVFAYLPPGASAQVSVMLQLPPQTPPGRYAAEAVIGSELKPVLIDVLESWDIAIAPGHISLKLHEGERTSRLLQLANRGNMPWRVHRAAFASLQEVDGVHRSFSLALKNTKGRSYEELLNDFVERMRETTIESPRLKFLDGPDILQPGEMSEFEIEISCPQNLKKHRRYVGKAVFENARLSLDIELIENGVPSKKERA
jgi:hypothetical protein